MAKEIPATVRFNNPGAMYQGPSARKFGSLATSIIGGGHQIAEFTDKVCGAAALFDLLARVYVNKSIYEVIEKWSGANDVESYVRLVCKRTGLSSSDKLTLPLLETPASGISLAKAMAKHETGRDYPMSDTEWAKAHALAFPSTPSLGSSPYELAKTFLGTREIAGLQDNPEIMRWYVDAGHPQEHDEVPNCSAFVCSMLARTNCRNPKTLLAKDHLKAHEECEPYEGCIVIMDRGVKGSWTGHVGFLARVPKAGDKRVRILGANQNNEVSEAEYPLDNVRGYRRPLPALTPVVTTVAKSRTLKTTLNVLGSLIASVGYWISGKVTEIYDQLPGTVDSVEQFVSTGQRVTGLLNINWPVALTVCIAIAGLSYTFVRGLGERRRG